MKNTQHEIQSSFHDTRWLPGGSYLEAEDLSLNVNLSDRLLEGKGGKSFVMIVMVISLRMVMKTNELFASLVSGWGRAVTCPVRPANQNRHAVRLLNKPA